MTSQVVQDLTYNQRPIVRHATGVQVGKNFYPYKLILMSSNDDYYPPPTTQLLIDEIRIYTYKTAADTGSQLIINTTNPTTASAILGYGYPAAIVNVTDKTYRNFGFLGTPGWGVEIALTGTFSWVTIFFRIAEIPQEQIDQTLTTAEKDYQNGCSGFEKILGWCNK